MHGCVHARLPAIAAPKPADGLNYNPCHICTGTRLTGSSVGDSDGAAVGSSVGASVGVSVGDSVDGLSVGDSTGASVASSAGMTFTSCRAECVHSLPTDIEVEAEIEAQRYPRIAHLIGRARFPGSRSPRCEEGSHRFLRAPHNH